MERQRTMYQMKEQYKTPEKQLNEVEIGNLPEKEFRIMIVKMIQDLGKRMEARKPLNTICKVLKGKTKNKKLSTQNSISNFLKTSKTIYF